MEDQSTQSTQEQSSQQIETQEQKPEHVDELDIIGGLMMKFFGKLFGSFKKKSS